jgi:hypothetical protein
LRTALNALLPHLQVQLETGAHLPATYILSGGFKISNFFNCSLFR